MKYEIHCDGLTEPNPGPGSWAFIVFDEFGEEVESQSGMMPQNPCTNNQTEYRAMIEALVWAHERDEDEVVIYSDSQLVVKQLNGEWQVASDNIRSWYDNANDLIEPHVKIAWIPGKDNQADELTRMVYEAATGLYPMPRSKKQRKAQLVKRSREYPNSVDYDNIAF